MRWIRWAPDANGWPHDGVGWLPYDREGWAGHNGGMNIAFAGGHAKWLNPLAIQYNMWTADPDD